MIIVAHKLLLFYVSTEPLEGCSLLASWLEANLNVDIPGLSSSACFLPVFFNLFVLRLEELFKHVKVLIELLDALVLVLHFLRFVLLPLIPDLCLQRLQILLCCLQTALDLKPEVYSRELDFD